MAETTSPDEWGRDDAWRLIDTAVDSGLPPRLRELIVSSLVTEHRVRTAETLSNNRIVVGRWLIRREDLTNIGTITETLAALTTAGLVAHDWQPQSATAALIAVVRTVRDLAGKAVALSPAELATVTYLKITGGARLEDVHLHLDGLGLSADLPMTRAIFAQLERVARRDQTVVPLIVEDGLGLWHVLP